MSMSSTRICTTVLRFTVLLCCWLQAHNVFAANITVQNTDPSIVYSPVESWSPSSTLCSTCLNPGISMSFQEGINSAPGPGPTVVGTSSTSISSTSIPSTNIPSTNIPSTNILSTYIPSTSIPSTSIPSTSIPSTGILSTSIPTASPPAPTPSPNLVTSEGGSPPTVFSSSPSPSPTDDANGSPHGSPGGKNRRALARQLLNSSGSVDTPVTLSYNFTGTAIYLFSIQPPTEINGTSTNTSLSFTLDNQPAENFSLTETSSELLPNMNVFSLDCLSNQPHQLVVTVGDGSVFLFDYLIYTNSSADTTAKSGKKNDVATFAGALGGSVGVLSLFCLGIAISIIRRRILAARRDRLDNEANGTSDTASMSGPRPFVPRFFPDTIIPSDPPTYNDALSSTNHNNAPSLLASLASSLYTSRQRSYADIPPNSPPPPLEELPPPPFPVALSARVQEVTIPAAIQTDLGSDSSNVMSPHEVTPLLLQSSNPDGDTRPRSRISTRSLNLSENSDLYYEEDASNS